MFDILSKLSEIKEKASAMNQKMKSESFTGKDSAGTVIIQVNGKKDIISIALQPAFSSLSLVEQEAAIKEAMDQALSLSESFIMNELKQVIPNIPGMNIFG